MNTLYGNFINPINAKDATVKWIRQWFDENGATCNAVIGISGGKDSSVVAALCVEALGKNRVFGVLMPNGEQHDKQDAIQLCDFLGIKYVTVNIGDAYNALFNDVKQALGTYEMDVSAQTTINMPPRIRMTTLYAISQSINGRVANTCNLSEDWVGYSTRYGDSVGDFSPISSFTSEEVVEIGRALGLPTSLIEKTPSDGLCGKTDEDNLGFSYAVLNRYIRTGICEDTEIRDKIDAMHKKNLFKLKVMPSFTFTTLPVLVD